MCLKISASPSVTRRSTQLNLQDYATKSFEAKRFTDFNIKSGASSFPVHRLVLACYSSFFEKLFQSSISEEHQNSAQLNDVDTKSLKILIDFMYNRNITINYENVLDILQTAHFLQINEVCDFCFDYLRTTITTENWYVVLFVLRLYKNDSLSKKLYQFVSVNFNAITQSRYFKKLTTEELKSLAQNLDRSIVTERSLNDAILSWITHDEINRKSEFSCFMSLLDLNQNSSDVQDAMLSTTLGKKNADCLNGVVDAPEIPRKKLRKTNSKLISIGGFETPSVVAEVYSTLSTPHKVYPSLPLQLLVYNKGLKMNEYIYTIGGSFDTDFQFVTNKVYRIRLGESKWKYTIPMSKERACMAATKYKDSIVVIGGVGRGFKRTRSAELFFPASNKWKVISDLNDLRSGAELVECDGSLYALGGYDGQRILASVERSSNLDKWEYSTPMKYSRFLFAAVCYKGEIYVIGGRCAIGNNISVLSSVEKFNSTERKWSSVESLKTARFAHAACLLDDKIYVVGGVNLHNEAIKLVECYNIKNGKWSGVCNIDRNLSRHCLVAIES